MAPVILLVGDSIVSGWRDVDRWAPLGVRLVNRGVAGQTSSQILRRFEGDLAAHDLLGVVVLAGGNDLRVLLGDPARIGRPAIDRLQRNIDSMVGLARRRGALVAVCTLTPVSASVAGARLGARRRDPGVIAAVNGWLTDFARIKGVGLIDLHAALVDADGRLDARFTTDGVHPNAAGFEAMGPILASVLTGMAEGHS